MAVNFGSWLWRLTSNTLFVVRRGHSHGRSAFLRTLFRVELKRMLTRVFPITPTTEQIFGATIEFFDYETFAILFEEIYVGDMYLFPSAVQDPVILDCGANIGMAVAYFKKLFPKAHITAFEADPVTHAMLVRNIERNGWSDVKAENAAVTGSPGSVTLYTGGQRGGLSHSVYPSPFASGATVTVAATPLSRIITTPVHLLKMDIEGAEDDVLRDLSASGSLSQVQQIILEYHLHLSPSEDRLGVFLSTLERGGFGYQIRAPLLLPFRQREFQCLILYAYRKPAAA